MTCCCSPDRKPALGVVVCAAVMAVISCAPTRAEKVAGEGSGGIIGSGGTSEYGGAGGGSVDPPGPTGGDTGLSTGGVTTSGGTGGGGTAGTSGPPPDDIPCTGNPECAATGQVCEVGIKLCVPCVKTTDCPAGGHCLGNRCVTFTPCSSKSDCSAASPVCDTTRGVCVQCVADTDCPTANTCTANKCVAVLKCKLNSDCTSNVCDAANNVCLECLVDSNCGSGKHCVRNACRTACKAAADCSSLGMVCDTANSACVPCLTTANCPPSWSCLANACVPDICDSTQSACSGTSVAGCNADGDRFDNFTSCASGKPCSARGAVAGCGGVPIRDAGGGSDAPAPTGDAGAGACGAGTSSDPCKAGIPKFTGTQTVDGNGSELCSLPAFVLNAQNAAKVIKSNSSASQFETATARVAWDSAGFHAYVEVQDSSVQTVYMADSTQAINKAYQGDSVEMFVSSSNNVTGLTSKDSNTIHIVVPATGPAVSVKDSSSSGTAAALPTNQYAQVSASWGYAVEVLLPWPGSAPSAGSAIRFDMDINSADKTFTNVDDMRDAQLIYYIGTVSGSSTCTGGDGTVPWCDDRAWCQANLL